MHHTVKYRALESGKASEERKTRSSLVDTTFTGILAYTLGVGECLRLRACLHIRRGMVSRTQIIGAV